MARPRGTVNRRPPGIGPGARSDSTCECRPSSPAKIGPASLTYVLDTLEIALEDAPRARSFRVRRDWLVKIVGAARFEDRRRRGVLRA